MIRKGYFIRHKKFMDVCLEVKGCFDYGQGMEIKGIWWNMRFAKSSCIGYQQRFNIAKSEEYISKKRKTKLQEWEFLTTRDQTFDCLRSAPWQEVRG